MLFRSTLAGRVLPVGGIKEKVLAAHRLGVKEVLLPRRNEKAFKEDIPENVRADLKIHLVSSIEEVLELALTPGDPQPIEGTRRRGKDGRVVVKDGKVWFYTLKPKGMGHPRNPLPIAGLLVYQLRAPTVRQVVQERVQKAGDRPDALVAITKPVWTGPTKVDPVDGEMNPSPERSSNRTARPPAGAPVWSRSTSSTTTWLTPSAFTVSGAAPSCAEIPVSDGPPMGVCSSSFRLQAGRASTRPITKVTAATELARQRKVATRISAISSLVFRARIITVAKVGEVDLQSA